MCSATVFFNINKVGPILQPRLMGLTRFSFFTKQGYPVVLKEQYIKFSTLYAGQSICLRYFYSYPVKYLINQVSNVGKKEPEAHGMILTFKDYILPFLSKVPQTSICSKDSKLCDLQTESTHASSSPG